MRVCGVIAEYDPFHNGHAWHIAQARALTRADFIVCVMSGAFTQRGMPALLSPQDRARMALENGADVVLSPPCAFSLCAGERFARGGVAILQAMGCVDALSFGVEEAGLPVFARAAGLLESPPEGLEADIQARLARGETLARARGEALAEALGTANDVLRAPNTALAICYARAALQLGAGFALAPVARQGDYHAEALAPASFPSATAVRAAALHGAWESVRSALPEGAYRLLRAAFEAGRVHRPGALDGVLRLTLRRGGDFSRLPDASEGIENLLTRAAAGATREEMIALIKSKRYTYARVNRLLSEALLAIDARDVPSLPPYAYVLGFRQAAAPLLRAAKKNGLALKTRLDPRDQAALARLDARADDLWLLGAGLPFGAGYRAKPVIVE